MSQEFDCVANTFWAVTRKPETYFRARVEHPDQVGLNGAGLRATRWLRANAEVTNSSFLVGERGLLDAP